MAYAIARCTCEKCGKSFERRVSGNNRADADNYAAYISDHPATCTECYLAQKKADEEKRRAEIIGDVELVKLTGSEKQISWAEKIRSNAVLAVGGLGGDLKRLLKFPADKIAAIEKMENVSSADRKIIALYKCFTTDSAAWIIENRDKF